MSSLDWAVLAAVLGWAYLAFQGILRLLALGVIPGNRKPSTGMAWLLLIVVVPVFGFIVFLLFGRTSLGEDRHARQMRAKARIRERTEALPPADLPEGSSPLLPSVVSLNNRLGSLPLVCGNGVLVLEDYDSIIELMTESITSATSYVHVEFYIMAWDELTDPFFTAMADAAERGVNVLFLFDHLGSRGIPGYRETIAKLKETKIQWHPMLPIMPLKGRIRRPDLRNHRKLLVVDGVVGYTGSLNLTERGYNKPKNHKLGRKWVECMVRVHGQIVATLDSVFAMDWYAETDEILSIQVRPALPVDDPGMVEDVSCQLVPSGPGFVAENNLRLFTTLIYSATRRISLTSPYFVPDESLLYAVTTAAQRGIEVELFVSEASDQFMVGHAQASYYRALLEAGVRIYLYPAPYILHSKHFTVDDDVALIGSSNMDMRSFALNYEISMMMLGPEIVARMRAVEDHYRDLSRELLLEEWLQRKPRLRYVDNALRLTAALQ
ncbi:MAG: cardiolipin synthase [Ornithinimicrobium sp.]|uniref:cardiolipin synthase n=1 Tax=Ornithinimicrobium sp. TaxID=1977084 RepID=UPI0026DEA65A|nr:cardiolipin synthase [Ornithinimicrobium sp.]MDO5739800.1 cardiolipin synthase [Ornithinimicrobium sp.]